MEFHLLHSFVKLVLLTFLTIESIGKPQQRRQIEIEPPRWSTQRSNYFPGADHDLTLSLSSTSPRPPTPTPPSTLQQQNHKFIFPNRFQPIVGQVRGVRFQDQQESRIQHNYYPPTHEYARGASYNPVFPQNKISTSTVVTTSKTPTPTPTTITTTTTTTEANVAEAASGTVTTSTKYTLPTPAPSNDENREIRFLIHKPGDEEIIKRALYEDSMTTHEQVSFLQGPTLKLEQKQKIILPPKRKTIVYVFIKEPEIDTKVEMIEPTENSQDQQPQVFIFYQKSNTGGIRGQKDHYLKSSKLPTVGGTGTINLDGTTLNSKQANLNKAPSASNQIAQTIEPPPPGCPTQFIKN